jgi:hypothetical protein
MSDPLRTRLPTLGAEPPHCRDCGAWHVTAGEALACDHRLGRHAMVVWGCPLCAAPEPPRGPDPERSTYTDPDDE